MQYMSYDLQISLQLLVTLMTGMIKISVVILEWDGQDWQSH